jgi:hypothetical protein
MLDTQSLWSDFGVVEELSESAAETISGGYEVFTIYNKTNYNITHVIDGKAFNINPNQGFIYTAYSGGIVKFDADSRNNYVQNKSYNLSNGSVYQYQDDKSTPGNPYDINLYKVS